MRQTWEPQLFIMFILIFLLRIKCFIAIIGWDMNARSGMSIPQISTAPLL